MIETIPPEIIVETLSPLISDARKEKIDRILENRLSSIQIAIERPYDPYNGLAIIRTGEAMGIFNYHLIATEYKRRRRVTSGSDRWVNIKNYTDLESYKPTTILAGAAIEGAIPLSEVPIDRPITLVFGNEHTGLTKDALAKCDLTYAIPMFGMAESYNLSVSAALSLHTLAEKRRAYLGTTGDLTPEEKMRERANAYIRTLKERSARLILSR
ncbi:MAG: RNA methyltransferase [Simkaniaceae bacterium]|nr:RNA methyltransferase [Simkaniaceae bacterium]